MQSVYSKLHNYSDYLNTLTLIRGLAETTVAAQAGRQAQDQAEQTIAAAQAEARAQAAQAERTAAENHALRLEMQVRVCSLADVRRKGLCIALWCRSQCMLATKGSYFPQTSGCRLTEFRRACGRGRSSK